MEVRGGQIVRRQTKRCSPQTTKEKRMPRLQTIDKTPVSSSALPRRNGLRPKTVRGPLHVQCTGHGDPNLLHQIIQEVLGWPQIESTAPFVGYQYTVSIRLRETACTDNASAFISGREFARVLQSANHLSRFAFGMRSWGDRSRVGRTALSYILRHNTGRRRRALYAAR